jgi:hypothetical protein
MDNYSLIKILYQDLKIIKTKSGYFLENLLQEFEASIEN